MSWEQEGRDGDSAWPLEAGAWQCWLRPEVRATLIDLSSSPRLSGSGIGPVNICKFSATPPTPCSASSEDLADLDS